MPNNRLDAVVTDIVEGVRDALRKNDVTFEEFRMGMGHIMKTAQAGELGLLIDAFFNTTIVENENKTAKGSPSDLEGPYFKTDVPVVTDGKIKTDDSLGGDPMLMKGHVKDPDGNPVEGAEIYIWTSTPDGKYSGFNSDLPLDYYRGKLISGSQGEYKAESTLPVPYEIPNKGPTGALLDAMGRHTWRPAHVHYKIRKPGFREFTTQAYFEGGDYVGDDCCQGQHTNDFVIPEVIEDGKRVMDIEFVLTPAA